jgi:predicted phage terminase large subunit-like protein
VAAKPDNHPDNIVLNPEQQARKKRLLSHLRIFAKETRIVPDYEAKPHDEMCDEMEKSKPESGTGKKQKRRLFLAPRYSYKTTIEVALMVWLVLDFRERGIDIHIDLMRAIADIAEDVLYEVKTVFEKNPVILELWGDLSLLAKEYGVWSAGKINLGLTRDPTISALGLDRGSAGKHPDIVIMDDIVNENNFESPKQKRAARMKVATYAPVLPPWGSMLVSGTRFAFNDVYGWIIETTEKAKRDVEKLQFYLDNKSEAVTQRDIDRAGAQWQLYIRAAVDDNGRLFFPGKLDHAYLSEQKKALEETTFYEAFFFNNPIQEGMNRFQMSYLEKAYFSAHYARWPIPSLEITVDHEGRAITTAEFPVRVTMTIDPTLTASGTSDWTGITVVATDGNGEWWILCALRYREVPSVIGERASELIRKYVPSICRIESAMADVEMVARIQKTIQAERLPTTIQSYNPMLADEVRRSGRRKKTARIEALQPRFASGKIHLHRDLTAALIDQYRHWPDVDHDDVFDALAMQIGLAKPCEWRSMSEAKFRLLEADDEEAGSIYEEYRTPHTTHAPFSRAGLSGGSRQRSGTFSRH